MTANSQIDQVQHDKEFSEFCQQLLSRKLNQVQLLTGSCFELPFVYYLSKITDIDVIVYRRNICAVAEGKKPPQNFKGTVLLVRSEESYPGFARLYQKKTGNKYVPYMFPNAPEQRPAIVSNIDFRTSGKSEFFHKVRRKEERQDNFHGLTLDAVYSIWCPYWPEEAFKWKIRERHYGWPSASTVENIVDKGCLFVAKPHQENQFVENEWRFSFSEAELILIQSWNDVQLYVYHILRLIKSNVVQKCGGKEMTVLSTYHFKTLMYWACEENPEEFWSPLNIESSIKKLLLDMIEWLIEKQCRNYFIPGNNMLHHLSNTHDFGNEIEYLLDAAEKADVYIRSIVPFEQGRMNEHTLSITTKELFFLHLRTSIFPIVNPSLPGRQRYMPNSAIEKTHAFRSLIVKLFNCLMIQRRLLQTNDLNEKLNLIKQAKQCFELANERKIGGSTNINISPWDNFHIIIAKLLTKDLDREERVESYEDTQNEKATLLTSNRHARQPYQELPNLLNEDTVHPAYFLYAAYETNFYYTVFERNGSFLEGCRKALQICDKILRYAESVRSSSWCHMFMGTYDLTVIISNRWSAIFDKFIQIVLGFFSLIKAVTSRGFSPTHPPNESFSSDVIVHVLPRNFLGYIRFQCNLHLNGLALRDNEFTNDLHNVMPNLVLNTAARISDRRNLRKQ